MIQERARELAILETMDGGEPVKESRDVDLPLVAAHFFYYAGWADKLDYGFVRKLTVRRCAGFFQHQGGLQIAAMIASYLS
ncbi:MAG: acyl-CoA reductase-like NAD-dependent aldehyde dehydrogenase [Verrucomicrobiales bacterium]|jgi:acyl-CoA reductase-like NAD-dependent aldehyde dehydrogenase